MEEEAGVDIDFAISHKFDSIDKREKSTWFLTLEALDPALEKRTHLLIDKILLQVPSEIRHGTQIVRTKEHEPLTYKDKLPYPTGQFEMPISIYWTRETGRHDKAHFLKYNLNIDHEDQSVFKATFHPEKLEKIKKARLSTPPKKITPLELLEICGKLPPKYRR